MNQRLKALMFVAALFAVGYGIMLFLNRGANNAANGAYKSVEVRRLPCGRFLQRTVEESNATWVKTVSLLSPDGAVLKTNTRTVEPEACKAIQAGRFVPNLWADCRVAIEAV